MKQWTIGGALVSVILTTSTQATETVSTLFLTPSTPWKIDFAEDSCSIERNFGTNDKLITLRLMRRGMNGGVDILVLGPLVPKFSERPELTFTFEPQGITQSLTPYSIKVPDAKTYYLRGFKNGFVNALQWSNKQVVRLTAEKKLDVGMEWIGAKSAFEVLQQCDDDLQRERGIDMSAIRAQKRGRCQSAALDTG